MDPGHEALRSPGHAWDFVLQWGVQQGVLGKVSFEKLILETVGKS